MISKIWRGGCIIRADLLEQMRKAYDAKVDLDHLLLDDWFAATVSDPNTNSPQVNRAGIGKRNCIDSII